jgi:hypothetical protein
VHQGMILDLGFQDGRRENFTAMKLRAGPEAAARCAQVGVSATSYRRRTLNAAPPPSPPATTSDAFCPYRPSENHSVFPVAASRHVSLRITASGGARFPRR